MQQHMNTHSMHNSKSNSNSQLWLSGLSAHCVGFLVAWTLVLQSPETESQRNDSSNTNFIQMGVNVCEQQRYGHNQASMYSISGRQIL